MMLTLMIPAFDHADIIAGRGTLGIEPVEQLPDIDAIVVPLSGVGLIFGVAAAAKALRPEIRIVGVLMERGTAMIMSLAAGHPVEVEEVPTLAEPRSASPPCWPASSAPAVHPPSR